MSGRKFEVAAVTGASGHIGSVLVRTLCHRGVHVRALMYEDSEGLPGEGFDRVRGDVTAPETLRGAFDGVAVVFHLAALVSLDGRDRERLWRTNVGGTRNVVAACVASGVRRLVHFSSIHALSPLPVGAPVDEERPLLSSEPVPDYDRSKAAGDRVVAEAGQAGLDVVTLHPTGCVGPHDYRPSLMGAALLSLYRGQMPGLVEGGFDWVDVRDIADAAIAAAERAPPNSRYVLSGEWASTVTVAEYVAALGGRPPPRLLAPMWAARLAAPVAEYGARLFGQPVTFNTAALHALRNHRHVRSERARRELDFASRPLRTSIEDALTDFRRRGVIA